MRDAPAYFPIAWLAAPELVFADGLQHIDRKVAAAGLYSRAASQASHLPRLLTVEQDVQRLRTKVARHRYGRIVRT